MTKRELAERIEKLEAEARAFRRHQRNDQCYRQVIHADLKVEPVTAGDGAIIYFNRTGKTICDALLDHLGLEIKTLPAEPEKIVLVKKAKA